ncbi:MAG TPA: hypothetical protein VIS99_00920, partial [Terrimicrobiaceae bacterium]
MVPCIRRVLFDELEENLPPGVVQEREQFLSEGFQVFNADHLDAFLDRFRRSSVICSVSRFWFHMCRL